MERAIDTLKQNIIIYDGVCNMCNASVRFISKRDKNNTFIFLSQQSDESKNILKKCNFQNTSLDTIVFFKNGTYFIKSDAVLEITKELTGYWFLFSYFKIVPKFIRNFIYDFIAKNRYRFFGKNNSCKV